MAKEDKDLLIKDLCGRLPYDCKVAVAEGGIDGLQWNNWLESLKERLQPKQAWSEEDEEMFDFCCNYLDDNQIAFLERLKARVQGKED